MVGDGSGQGARRVCFRPSRQAIVVGYMCAGFAAFTLALGVAFFLTTIDGAILLPLMLIGAGGYGVWAIRSVRCRVQCEDGRVRVANVWRTVTLAEEDVVRIGLERIHGDVSGNGFLMGLPGRIWYGMFVRTSTRGVSMSASRRRTLGELERDWGEFLDRLDEAGMTGLRRRLEIIGPDGTTWPSRAPGTEPRPRHRRPAPSVDSHHRPR